jgi:hypothetical protein
VFGIPRDRSAKSIALTSTLELQVVFLIKCSAPSMCVSGLEIRSGTDGSCREFGAAAAGKIRTLSSNILAASDAIPVSRVFPYTTLSAALVYYWCTNTFVDLHRLSLPAVFSAYLRGLWRWAMLGSNQRPPPCKLGRGFPTTLCPVREFRLSEPSSAFWFGSESGCVRLCTALYCSGCSTVAARSRGFGRRRRTG